MTLLQPQHLDLPLMIQLGHNPNHPSLVLRMLLQPAAHQVSERDVTNTERDALFEETRSLPSFRRRTFFHGPVEDIPIRLIEELRRESALVFFSCGDSTAHLVKQLHLILTHRR